MNDFLKELKDEANRLEEDATYSGKRHYAAFSRWRLIHYIIGSVSVALALVGTTLAFQELSYWVTGVLTVLSASITIILTLLNPSEKSAKHKASGDGYFALKDEARCFRNITVRDVSNIDEYTVKLKELMDVKFELRKVSPNTSNIDFKKARKAIEEGEVDYKIDGKDK